jgi:hypothetical protein
VLSQVKSGQFASNFESEHSEEGCRRMAAMPEVAGEVRRFILLARDTTGRKRAEMASKQGEERLRL